MTRISTWRRTCPVLVLALAAAPFVCGQEPAGKAKPATLIVRIRGDATLLVDDTTTRQTGEVRRFYSPPLQPGKNYYYTLVARWEPNNYTTITRTRRVPVEAGKEVKVDLTQPDPKEKDDIVIRWVPTPPEVVDRMLEMGKVGKDDVVWDLGCGDGRIPISAVAKFKARRGVGIDIDAKLLEEAKANAAKAGVEGKVEFRKGDVLKIKDFSEASVVTLYMGNELNQAVRPALQKSLKPGSRIVSHRFLMGDWKPDKTETMTVDGEEYLIHLWTIKK
jgi:uncharacterized protein (TIGR03000 family)